MGIIFPSAIKLPDGQFSVSSSAFGGTIRVNLSFQILENLTGAFRYARIPSASGDHRGYYWDRSFDLHYLLNKEKKIFVATNLLESMLEKSAPTRGEANDIFNSLEMGANGLVLAAETAIGKHPKNSVNFLRQMIKVYLRSKY